MAKPKAEDPMLVRTDKTVEALEEALATRFSTSFKAICHDFKCSRAWAEKYVKPNVHRLYISGGVPNFYTRRVFTATEDEKNTSATWYDTSEYRAWASESATTYERTKHIPLPFLAPNPMPLIRAAQEIIGTYEAARERVKRGEMPGANENTDLFLYRDKRADKAWDAVVEASGRGLSIVKTLFDSAVHRPRGTVPWIQRDMSLEFLGFFEHSAETPASMLDWGDASEIAHRRIQREGMIKIVFSVVDANGERGERVLYTPDPNLAPCPPELSTVLGIPELRKCTYINLDTYYELSGGVVPDWTNLDSVRSAIGLRPLADVLE